MRSDRQRWSSEMRIAMKVSGGQAYVAYPFLGGDIVEHDDGTWSPVDFEYVEWPDDPRLPGFIVECDYSREDLLPRVKALHVIRRDPEREVMVSDLRSINLHQAIETAWMQVSRRPSTVQPGDVDDQDTFGPGDELAMKHTLRGLRQRVRRRITDRVLEEVADVYRSHVATGAPTKAVKEHFGIAESTASAYVKRARDAGKHMGTQPTEPPREG